MVVNTCLSTKQKISEENIWYQNMCMKTIKDRGDHLMRNFVTHITLPVLVEQNVRWLLSLSQTDTLGGTKSSVHKFFQNIKLEMGNDIYFLRLLLGSRALKLVIRFIKPIFHNYRFNATFN
jgi:hypothetical protein